MTFIVEFIPKQAKKDSLSVVVRAQNGFPLAVFDDLDSAKEFIHSKVNEASQAFNSNLSDAKN